MRTDKGKEYLAGFSYCDMDLNIKLEAWEYFYNFNGLHGAFDGWTPFETLKTALNNLCSFRDGMNYCDQDIRVEFTLSGDELKIRITGHDKKGHR